MQPSNYVGLISQLVKNRQLLSSEKSLVTSSSSVRLEGQFAFGEEFVFRIRLRKEIHLRGAIRLCEIRLQNSSLGGNPSSGNSSSESVFGEESVFNHILFTPGVFTHRLFTHTFFTHTLHETDAQSIPARTVSNEVLKPSDTHKPGIQMRTRGNRYPTVTHLRHVR